MVPILTIAVFHDRKGKNRHLKKILNWGAPEGINISEIWLSPSKPHLECDFDRTFDGTPILVFNGMVPMLKLAVFHVRTGKDRRLKKILCCQAPEGINISEIWLSPSKPHLECDFDRTFDGNPIWVSFGMVPIFKFAVSHVRTGKNRRLIMILSWGAPQGIIISEIWFSPSKPNLE
jgi:hypothetical protein